MIKDLKENEKFAGCLLVGTVAKGVSNNGVPYFNLTLQDSSGSIEAKKWSIDPGEEDLIKPGNIVEFNGEVIKYKTALQMKIIGAKKYEMPIDVANFIKPAPVAKEDLLNKLFQYIGLIKNADIKLLVETIVNKNIDALAVFPAATRNHHEYCSGLLHHVTSMLDIGQAIKGLYQVVDSDMLYAGIILHDIGKIYEFSGPILPKYSLEGKLLGHISIMNSMIKEEANLLNLKGENIILLQHMILSHHGKLEYGSPVVPLTLEAELLHLIDNIDSKINMFDKALQEINEGEFSIHQYPLEGRSIYKPNKKSD